MEQDRSQIYTYPYSAYTEDETTSTASTQVPRKHNSKSSDLLEKGLSNISSTTSAYEGREKGHYNDEDSSSSSDDEAGPQQVLRHLKARHVSMISLGGTIGAGLFIGTSDALQTAGPVGALIGYIFTATIVYSVAQSLGEMATFIPLTGSFTQFASRFVSPSFGAAVGWLYWFSWSMTFAVELNAAALVINYWTDKVPVAAWTAIFFVLLTVTNLVAVKYYGEIEFWAASIKVVTIVGWILYALVMVCGGGKTGPVGFRYWKNPGPWGDGYLVDNLQLGRFLGFVSSLVNAAFTYQGTELVGITAGESTNPRKNVPKAIHKVFFRILIFYIMSLFFIGLLVPFNDKQLNSDASYIASSPFVIAIVNSGTKVLPSIFNAVVLSTVLSAGNSDVYIGSRVLYALSASGVAPSWFQITNKSGVPYVGVLTTAVFGALAFMNVSSGAENVFNWLVNISTVAGMIAWCSISLSHLRFMKAVKAQGFSRMQLPYVSRWAPAYVWYALICNIVVIFIQGFTSFFSFSASSFLTSYISVFVFIILWVAFQFLFGCPLYLKSEDIDLDSGRIEVERTEWIEPVSKTWYQKLWNSLF